MKKPKKLKTTGGGIPITHLPRRTAGQKELKKPKQNKSKEDRVADGEELPVTVRFEI